MRIVNWAEFATLPTGTIFQEVSEYSLGALTIRGDVLSSGGKPIDFIECRVLPTATDTGYFGQGEFERDGVTFPDDCPVVMWPSHYGRDGLFEYGRQFLIWEEADRKRLARMILDPLNTCAPHDVLLKVEDPR